MSSSPEARRLVRTWIDLEREAHADVKFSGSNDEIIDALLVGGWAGLESFVQNYLKRVELFGLETRQGRQALGKAIVTLTDWLERSCDSHGMMPLPGQSSGNVREWIGYPQRGHFPT